MEGNVAGFGMQFWHDRKVFIILVKVVVLVVVSLFLQYQIYYEIMNWIKTAATTTTTSNTIIIIVHLECKQWSQKTGILYLGRN